MGWTDAFPEATIFVTPAVSWFSRLVGSILQHPGANGWDNDAAFAGGDPWEERRGRPWNGHTQKGRSLSQEISGSITFFW